MNGYLMGLGLAAGLLAANPVAAAITGHVGECIGIGQLNKQGQPECIARGQLQIRPGSSATDSPVSLFIGIFQVADGEPNPTVGGWFDGRSWQTGMPVPAYTGQLSARQATVTIPGGVCGLALSAGGPEGTYGLYAGWGMTDIAGTGGDLDVEALNQAIAESDPQTAAELRQALVEYKQAQGRWQVLAATGNGAFTAMRNAGTYWLVERFDCWQPQPGSGGGGRHPGADVLEEQR